ASALRPRGCSPRGWRRLGFSERAALSRTASRFVSNSATPGSSPMRRIGRHSLVYGAGLMLTKAVSFVMLPVYTRYLTPADYGVMTLISMTLDVIAIMAGTKVALGIFRYYHKA